MIVSISRGFNKMLGFMPYAVFNEKTEKYSKLMYENLRGITKTQREFLCFFALLFDYGSPQICTLEQTAALLMNSIPMIMKQISEPREFSRSKKVFEKIRDIQETELSSETVKRLEDMLEKVTPILVEMKKDGITAGEFSGVFLKTFELFWREFEDHEYV